jgi:hypothetical protein
MWVRLQLIPALGRTVRWIEPIPSVVFPGLQQPAIEAAHSLTCMQNAWRRIATARCIFLASCAADPTVFISLTVFQLSELMSKGRLIDNDASKIVGKETVRPNGGTSQAFPSVDWGRQEKLRSSWLVPWPILETSATLLQDIVVTETS